MDVLLIGSGGREHALAWAISKSSKLNKLYCAPGNAGIADVAECLKLNIENNQEILEFAKSQKIDLVVVGPEVPLVNGLVDSLTREGISSFGPTASAALLEGSKLFTKELCKANNIPTAAFERFDNQQAAFDYLDKQAMPIVIKDDGLAAGKGVCVAQSLDEAKSFVESIFFVRTEDEKHEVLIEECLIGEEASFFVLCDGETAIPFGTAQDHKRAYDNDKGPNTGGMGAYSPAPIMTSPMIERTMQEIINPTISAMAKAGTPFTGILYAGLMINETGPKLIEYNVRFGDPECQVLMMRLESDFLDILQAATETRLHEIRPDWSDDSAITVVMASKGYPGSYEKGSRISGLEKISDSDTFVFHAGTGMQDEKIIATGGRVLNVTAKADTIKDAQTKAYDAVKKIDWPQGFYRTDIGWRAVNRD